MVFFEDCPESDGVSLLVYYLDHDLYFSISYSILINGAPTKPFKARKGLRRGDPMSHYLFAIFMEYSSSVD